MTNTSRIAKNTLMLYFRQILIMLVSLYTMRVVLAELGAEDYGIYNVVAGVVTMFGFLSGSMASATQRFFSFALGEGDGEKLSRTFNVNITIYAAIALVSVVLLESAGQWFVRTKLVLPMERVDAAVWLFHFSVASFVCSIFSSPFVAIIIAHEDMGIYAGVGITEVLLKLASVLLLKVVPGDSLEVYGALVFAAGFVTMGIYLLICAARYKECRIRKGWDKNLFREITGFTVWTLFGQLSGVARNQVVTIMVNQFFTPIVVAARSVAMNVSHAVNVFASNFNTGLYPPIIKEYAAKNKDGMFSLVFNGCKATFFLMWVFALPLMLEINAVFAMWLGDGVPEYAADFSKLALLESVVNSISLPIVTAARAPGKMRVYELTLGILQFLIPLASLPLFYAGFPPHAVFVMAILVNIIMFVVRIMIVRPLIGFPARKFAKEVFKPLCLIAFLSFAVSLGIKKILPRNLLCSSVCILFSAASVCAFMWIFGIGAEQREKVKALVFSKLKRPKSGRKKMKNKLEKNIYDKTC